MSDKYNLFVAGKEIKLIIRSITTPPETGSEPPALFAGDML
jgi:hypothetical protein